MATWEIATDDPADMSIDLAYWDEKMCTRYINEFCATANLSITAVFCMRTSRRSTMVGFIGMKNPSDIKRLGELLQHGDGVKRIITRSVDPQPMARITITSVDRFIESTSLATMAAFVGTSWQPAKHFKLGLKRLEKKWNEDEAHRDDQAYVAKFRFSKDSSWALVDVSTARFGRFIMERPSASGHYWEFVYRLNSRLKTFDPKTITATRGAKEALYRNGISEGKPSQLAISSAVKFLPAPPPGLSLTRTRIQRQGDAQTQIQTPSALLADLSLASARPGRTMPVPLPTVDECRRDTKRSKAATTPTSASRKHARRVVSRRASSHQ